MKKIKNIKQLKKEKKLLRQREKELLRQINSGWQHLKENLRPQNILKAPIGNGREIAANKGESILKSTLSFGASLLAKKFLSQFYETGN